MHITLLVCHNILVSSCATIYHFSSYTMFLSHDTILLFLVLLMIEKLTSPLTKILFVIFLYALISLFFLKSSNRILLDIFNQGSSRHLHSRLSWISSTKHFPNIFNQTLLDIFNQSSSRHLQLKLWHHLLC